MPRTALKRSTRSTNFIEEYRKKIESGEIIANSDIKAVYAMVDEDLKSGLYHFDSEKAQEAIDFFETFCHHVKGRLAPGRIQLELWQKAMLSCIFGLVDEDGLRWYREILVLVGRKNGKTIIASGTAEHETFRGEFGGEIYFTAPKLLQANLGFDGLHNMLKTEPDLLKRVKKRRSDIYYSERNTTVAPLAFSANTSDGFNISLGVCDELAAWPATLGKKFYEVLKSSMGSRSEPMLLSITTSGYVNGGPFDELYSRATKVLKGSSKERRLLPFLYHIEDLDKWNDMDELKKANPNLGVSVSTDFMQEEISIAETSFSKKAEFLTKYCCVKQNSSTAFLRMKDVERAIVDIEDPLEFFKGSYCVAGIDLSRTTDLSAVVHVIERQGTLYLLPHFWLPTDKIEEASARDDVPYFEMIQKGYLSASGQGYIEYEDLEAYMDKLLREYEIIPRMTGYDAYSSTYLVKHLNQKGYPLDDVRQGFNLNPAIDELEQRISDGTIKIVRNDIMTVHLLDAATEQERTTKRRRLVKIEDRDNIHIDGVAAILCALIVRQKHYEILEEILKNN